MPIPRWLIPYLHAPLPAILAIGFACGVPLALTASTLSLWLKEAQVDKAAIGLFAAVALPYSFRFAWSPLVDGMAFPVLSRLLGRRKGWMIGMQLLLALSIVLLGLADPAANPWVTALAALLVAACSATLDIVCDAFRIEALPEERQGHGAAVYILGYRLGMIASSAGALYLATYFGWQATYFTMALLLGIGTLAALCSVEPESSLPPGAAALRGHDAAGWLHHYVVEPLRNFRQRPMWLSILCFTALYKLPDAFIGLMSNPFLVETGFTKIQIADIAKLYGLLATIAGGFIGAKLIERYGLIRILWVFGLGQGLTNLLYVALVHMGPDLRVLAALITADNLVNGISSVAFVAYLSALCDRRFTATQYALLGSLANIGRTLLSTPAGIAAEALGWSAFFTLSVFLAAPALVLLYAIARRGADPAQSMETGRQE